MNLRPLTVAVGIVLFGSIVCPQAAYFPPNSLEESPKSSQFKEQWYSKELSGLHEPSLWEASRAAKQVQVYRFLYLRAFDHPIVVRVEVNMDGKGLLTTKVAGWRNGSKPGHLIVNKTRKMSVDQTNWFLYVIDQLGFWQLPTHDKSDVMGLDGSQWILEGVKDGKYLVVDRWSPHEGPVKGLGTVMMFDLAKIKLLYQEVY
jgi:hypothetical protein